MNVRRFSLKSLLGFVLIPMLGIISPLLALPALTSSHGESAWSDVAVGQAIGLGAGVVIELGWGLNGPQRVSRTSFSRAKQYYAISFATKLVAFFAIGIVAFAIGFLLAPSDPWLTAWASIGSAATGLTPVWFFIGLGRPAQILFCDTLPRVSLILASAILLYNGSAAVIYPIVGILVPALITPVIAMLILKVTIKDIRGLSRRRLWMYILFQRHAVVGRLASSAYISLPVAIVGVTSPQAVASFAAVDRLTRMSLTVLSAIPNALQGWVGSSGNSLLRKKRIRQAVGVSAIAGVVSGLGFIAFAPTVAELVFSGTVLVSTDFAWYGGLIIFIVCFSRATGNIALVAKRQIRSIAHSAVLGAIAGLPLIVFMSYMWKIEGALLAVLLTEMIVLTYQVVILSKFGNIFIAR